MNTLRPDHPVTYSSHILGDNLTRTTNQVLFPYRKLKVLTQRVIKGVPINTYGMKRARDNCLKDSSTKSCMLK